MKILICTHTYLPEVNGVAQAAYNQYKILSELGHDVQVLSSSQSDLYPEIVKSFKINGNGRYFSPFNGEVKEYLDYLSNSNHDVVFFHCWENWVTELVLRLNTYKFKKIVFSHGTSHSMKINSFKGILRWIVFLPFRKSFKVRMNYFDFYIFLTNYANSDRFNDKLYFERNARKDFLIIPNISIIKQKSDILSFKKRYALPDKKIILCVSNFSRLKGQDIALKAFAELNIQTHILVFIGSTENKFSLKLKKDNSTLIGKTVFFLTNVNKELINQAYFESDFFIFCSQTEAQPLVILDCISTKLPFLSSNVGCVSEIKGGLIYKNMSELKINLLKLINDQNLKTKLSNEGYIDFKKNYSIDVIKHKYIELINQIRIL